MKTAMNSEGYYGNALEALSHDVTVFGIVELYIVVIISKDGFKIGLRTRRESEEPIAWTRPGVVHVLAPNELQEIVMEELKTAERLKKALQL